MGRVETAWAGPDGLGVIQRWEVTRTIGPPFLIRPVLREGYLQHFPQNKNVCCLALAEAGDHVDELRLLAGPTPLRVLHQWGGGQTGSFKSKRRLLQARQGVHP